MFLGTRLGNSLLLFFLGQYSWEIVVGTLLTEASNFSDKTKATVTVVMNC